MARTMPVRAIPLSNAGACSYRTVTFSHPSDTYRIRACLRVSVVADSFGRVGQ